MEKIITACIFFVIFLFLLVISIRSFKEKGLLLNNAYLYAPKKERANMHKGKYYHQSAVALFLVSLIFLVDGIAVLLEIDWTFYIVLAIVLIAMIFAIVSSIIIKKKKQ